MELEEEAAELSEEITEDEEERKYDLQIQAWEDMQKAFEDAIEEQIKAIDKIIDKLREEQEALREVSSGGGGGGSFGGMARAAELTEEQIKVAVQGIIAALREELGPETVISAEHVKNIFQQELLEHGGNVWAAISETIRRMRLLINEANAAQTAIQNALSYAASLPEGSSYTPQFPGGPAVITNPVTPRTPPRPPSHRGRWHEGGSVEELHSGIILI